MASTTFDTLIDHYQPSVQQISRDLRDLIRAALPTADEQVDPADKLIAYGFGRRYADLICAIAPFTSHVNLMFSRGTSLPDPDRLLIGTGKRARHVRLENRAEVANPALRALLEAVVDLHQQPSGSPSPPNQVSG